MRLVKSMGAGLLLGVVVAACGSSSPTQAPAATSADGGGGGGGGGATQAPQATAAGGATQAGGGGGGTKPAGWDQYGKAHMDVSGPSSLSVDLGFLPAASHFGGTDATILYFTIEGTEQVLNLTWTTGTMSASFASTDITVAAGECTTSNVNIGATSASGSFDCTGMMAVLKSGASTQGAGLKGTFEAHG